MTLICCQLSIWKDEYVLIYVFPGIMSHNGKKDKREEGKKEGNQPALCLGAESQVTRGQETEKKE